ncbi:hypothetical protein, partial [Elstera litoralis]|uniref:hypothetical protein n=1 Tax=Elstera litoralis TaxID=552518 RepID=UPI0018DBCF50
TIACLNAIFPTVALGQGYDLSKLNCQNEKVLADFADTINSSSVIRQAGVQLIDIKSPKTISAKRDALECSGVLLFSSGEKIPMKFEMTASNLGRAIWRWEQVQ